MRSRAGPEWDQEGVNTAHLHLVIDETRRRGAFMVDGSVAPGTEFAHRRDGCRRVDHETGRTRSRMEQCAMSPVEAQAAADPPTVSPSDHGAWLRALELTSHIGDDRRRILPTVIDE